jgi:hypothetical protein
MSDQESPPQGGGEAPVLPPPAPESSASGADASQAGPALEARPPRQRRLGIVVGAAAVVLALVGGLVAFQLTRPGEEAQALALSFTQGQTESYVIHMTMNGSMSIEGFGQQSIQDMPLDIDMTETMTWKVLSVDDGGVATVETSITDVSGTANGVEIPASASEMPPTQMKIAPDGRLLDLGGMSIPSSLKGSLIGGVPGLGQYTPLLPDGPVKPGQSWTKHFSQGVPFGKGKIEFTTVSTLERYETVNGVKAAVITTEFELPVDFTIDFDELLAAQGTSGDADMSGVSAKYGGKVTLSMTAWVDPSAQQLLRSSATGDLDMFGEMSGSPEFTGHLTLKGRFSQGMDRK